MFNGNTRYIVDYLLHPYDIYRNYRMWINAGTSSARIILVVGAPRSGTTLLQRIIGGHSSVGSLNGETSVFSPKNVYNYERFSHVMTASEHAKALARSIDIVDFFENIHDVPEINECRYILEKTPQHVKKLRFILEHFENAKIVNIYRDPRDAYCSGRKAGNIPQASSLRSYAAYWNKCVRSRLLVGDSKQVFDVKYEDLVAEPESIIDSVMRFIGLERELQQLDLRVIGNDPRSSEKAFSRLNQPITADTVGVWRNVLSSEEKRRFARFSGSLLDRVGYAKS